MGRTRHLVIDGLGILAILLPVAVAVESQGAWWTAGAMVLIGLVWLILRGVWALVAS